MEQEISSQKIKLSSRKWLLAGWLLILFTGISLLFWYNELVYSLPTPVPEKYVAVEIGTRINLSAEINFDNCKPTFIHFFNPDCPCSRFNIPHFKSLVKEYGDKVNFVMVVLNKDKIFSAKEIQERFEISIPVLFDKKIADKCGVYSTPQAAILDSNSKLFYRGNYNKSRYCTDAKSDFAQQAIIALINHNKQPQFGQLATLAYGCSLPNCKK